MPNLFDSEEFFVDPNKDWYTELVGEGRKYKDQNALARANAEKDAYVARLEAENKGIRNELQQSVKFEELLDKISSAREDDVDTPRKVPPTETPALKPDDIERLLEQKMNQRDQARIAEQNVNIVTQKLRETYGPNYAQRLKQQADELSMTETQLHQLASSNPKAFFKLIGISDKPSQKETFVSPFQSHSSDFSLPPNKGKGDSYYEEIRRTSPRTYWSPKVQNEIFERVKEIGAETFYST